LFSFPRAIRTFAALFYHTLYQIFLKSANFKWQKAFAEYFALNKSLFQLTKDELCVDANGSLPHKSVVF
jgi:hypothetical protein